MRKGKFVVVEGISGSGQQVKLANVALHKALVEEKYDVVECANPDSGRANELGMTPLVNWPFAPPKNYYIRNRHPFEAIARHHYL